MNDDTERVGVTRKLDKRGRVYLPSAILDTLNLDKGSNVEFYVNKHEDTLIMKKAQDDHCLLCGEATDTYYNGRPLCSSCVTDLKSENLQPDSERGY